MNKINVECRVNTYNPHLTDDQLLVKSAEVYGEVTLVFGRDLITAVENCVRT